MYSICMLTICTNAYHGRSRSDLYRFVTPDYYGYRDDDDGILKTKELEREVKYRMVELLQLPKAVVGSGGSVVVVPCRLE